MIGMIDMTELEQLSSSQDEIIHIIWYIYIYTHAYICWLGLD